MPHLIVFSHLRWNFVYQRPQHLLTRLAPHFPVVFVEEPVPDAPQDRLEHLRPAPHIELLRPHVRASSSGFHDDHLPALSTQLAAFLHERGITDYGVWLYTPMALPLVHALAPRAVVYDCMDELSAFRGAPRQLVQRESALYQVADLVLTGGPSLYEAKRQRHRQVHLFPSSVDAPHFASGQGREHPAQQDLPHPRLGYHGVIDERLDLGLLAALADARPDWQLVMVGPVAKIAPESLPHRPNIHWLGQRPYEELPALVAGWDVCLMPFALNEATRYISPTKTLEYMAAGKPVVSTPIRDVAQPHGDVVEIAEGMPAFLAACERVLAEPPDARAQRLARMTARVALTSWDQTASAIGDLLGEVLHSRPPRPQAANADHAGLAPMPGTGLRRASQGPVRAAGQSRVRAQAMQHPTVILGAGPTGLAAAHHLGEDALLLEKGATVGGWCRSIEDRGFTFDCAGHIMFSNDPHVLDLYDKLLGENVHWQNREAWIYSKNVYTRYPFQGALYGLPPEVLKECLVGAIEARFGPIRKEAAAGPVAGVIAKPQPPRNFEEFIHKVWGAGVARHFAIPYNRKLWAVPLHEMETSWLGGRVPLPDLEEMIEGALQPVAKPMGPNARFGYPLRGGFQALMNGFLPLLKGPLLLDADVVAVSPSRRSVTLSDGRIYGYDTLISTLPLPKLVEAMGTEAPEHVRAAAQSLRHVSVRCVNLGIGREQLTDKHWIYYPEDTVFHRIFVQGNASPHCNAPGGFGLTCEISYSDYKPLPCEGQALIDRCIEDCIRVGLIRADDPVWAANEVDMPYAYVVYDHARAQHVQTIRRWVAHAHILLAGRYSEWEYYNSDHAFVAGRKAAEQAKALQSATFTSAGSSTLSAHEPHPRPAPSVAATAASAAGGQFKPAA